MKDNIDVKDTWRRMLHRLAVVIPLKVIAWLDKEKLEVKRKHPLTILIVLLIMLLSVASITNLYTRASSHHPGISAYATGGGLALLVPISIFFAVYVPLGKVGKSGAWAISIVFAVMSAAIQYKIYSPGDTSISLEAVAFGAGIPVAECLLAVLEGILINYLTNQEQAKERDAVAKLEAETQKVQAQAQAERDRTEAKRKADEQAKALEAQQATQFAFEMEAKRKRLDLELELERKKLEAKLNAPPRQRNDSRAIQSESKPIQQSDSESRLIQYYKLNPKASQRKAAQETGISQSTVNRILSELESNKVIHRNGNGVEVL